MIRIQSQLNRPSSLRFPPTDRRKKNQPTLNFCFLGNPGTGKTTVARLFAGVLHDSALRGLKTFVETAGQTLKDNGVDEFRQKASTATNGTLVRFDRSPLSQPCEFTLRTHT